jgi:hypothetical protein
VEGNAHSPVEVLLHDFVLRPLTMPGRRTHVLAASCACGAEGEHE